MIMLLLFLFEALIVGGAFASRQLERGGVLHGGYIALDLAFLFISVVIILGASSFILFGSLRKKISTQLDRLLDNKNWFAGFIISCSLICYEIFQDYLFLRSDMLSVHYFQYRELLLDSFPGLILIFLSSFQFLLFLFISKWNLVRTWVHENINVRGAIIFLGLLFAFFLLNYSGYGFIFGTEDAARAHTMNAPLLGIQILLITGGIIVSGWILGRVIKKWPVLETIIKSELVIVIGLWILAVGLWSNSPVGSNYYIDIPRAPNYELYPSSDQLKYEIQALDLLEGGGMRPNVLHPIADYIQHPLHSLYLAVLHAISGEGYQDILFPQILILSFLPVLLYKIGSLIHTRFSGLVVGVLYLVRERNAIFLGEHITVSNVKTVMTEPLALLVFLIFLYLLLLWIRSENQKPWLVILAGGVFGALVLIRIEVLAFLPVIGLVVLFYFRRNWLVWVRGVGMAGITIILMITPWMVRNYQVEGRFELDKSFYIRWIFDKYRDYFLPEVDGVESSNFLDEMQLVEIPGAGKNAVSAVILPGGESAIEAQTESPTTYFMDHFVNSIQQTVYYLPNNHQPLLTAGSLEDLLPGNDSVVDLEEDPFLERYLERYVKGLPYWSFDWDGKLIARSYLPFMVTIGLISYGLIQLKKDRMWIPVLFLLLIITQSAVFAVLSGSGGRSIAIVDWIPLLFYGIGLSALLSKGLTLVQGPVVNNLPGEFSTARIMNLQSKNKMVSFMVLGGVILAGLTLPISEIVKPSPYTEAALEAQIEILKNNSSINVPLENREGEVVLFGKALFPRFFEAYDRMEDDRNGIIPDYSYQRTEFYLVGSQNTWVSLPMEETIDFFPHGSEVLIWAELEDGEISPDGNRIHGRYYKSSLIYILNANQPTEYPIPLRCSGEECVSVTE